MLTPAWKSSAARLPKPRMKMVAQSQKMALGNGESAHGLVIWSSKMRWSPMGYAPLSARHDDPSAGHHQ